MSEIKKDKLAEAVEQEFEKAVEKSSEVADQLLMAQGWDILNELHKATYASVIATSMVMIPAMQNKDTILEKVTDKQSFQTSMDTASKEISEMVKSVQMLHKGHSGKTGTPGMEDIELISELTMGYSRVQTAMETAVEPLLMAIVEKMQEAGVDTDKMTFGEEDAGV